MIQNFPSLVGQISTILMKGDLRRSNYDLPQDLAEVAVEIQAEPKVRDSNQNHHRGGQNLYHELSVLP